MVCARHYDRDDRAERLDHVVDPGRGRAADDLGDADEAERARHRADEATAQAEAVGACARGYLSAIGSAFDAASISEGVDQVKSDIEALNSSCLEKLGS